MKQLELTKMSSRGQIVLPQDIRNNMHLQEGTPFAVMGFDDTIILKRVRMPTLEDFEKLAEKGAKIAKERGLKEKDVEGMVHRHRRA